MFFLHKKHLTQRNLYTQTAHRGFCRPIFLHAETLPRAVFTQQKVFRTETFTHKKNMHNSFCRQTVFTHRKFSAQKSYAQKVLHTTFFFTYRRFTHRCLYTDTNCTQKLVHTARVYTQPIFTQRGFASPSCSCSASFAVCRWKWLQGPHESLRAHLCLCWAWHLALPLALLDAAPAETGGVPQVPWAMTRGSWQKGPKG